MSNLGKVKRLFDEPLPKRPAWIESGILPKRSKVLIGGGAKIGKTFLLLNMAIALTTAGTLWKVPEFKVPHETGVLYIDQELGEYELQRRVKRVYDGMGKTPADNFFYLSRVPELEMDRRDGRELLADYLRSEPSIEVVMLDPISQSMYGDDSNNNDVKHVFQQIDFLLNAFEDRDLSVVLSHHFGKPPKLARDVEVFNPSDKYNFRGASKWVDNPDALATVVRQECNSPGVAWQLQTEWTLRTGMEPEPKILNVLESGVVEQSKGLFTPL